MAAIPPPPVSDLFALMVPGRALITAFQPVDQTKMVCTIPDPSQLTQFAVSLLRPEIPPGTGVGVYYSAPDGAEWNYLGNISLSSPSAFFRAAWNGTLSPALPCVHIMLALETEQDLADKVTSDQVEENRTLDSVRAIAENLYTYMSSFTQPQDRAAIAAAASSRDYLIIPTNFIDRWMQKFADKHRKNPFFWLKGSD